MDAETRQGGEGTGSADDDVRLSYPKLEQMTAGEILRAEWNPRKARESTAGILEKSYDHYGELQPLTYNAKTQTLLDGHRRLETLPPETRVDVWVVWLSEEQEKGAVLALNNSFGHWKEEGIGEALATGDHQLAGFSASEASEFLLKLDEDAEVSEEALEKLTLPSYRLSFTDVGSKLTWDNLTAECRGVDALTNQISKWLIQIQTANP
jgi:hypothetical protein